MSNGFINKCLLTALFASALIASPITAAELKTPCEDGARVCSDDAYSLNVCKNGAWETVSCMAGSALLCDKGECVLPAKYGSPKWPDAADEPRATKSSLAQKAEFYDGQSQRLFLSPELKFATSLSLQCKTSTCPPDQKTPCNECSETTVPEETATWKDVVKWHPGENDGLFSGLYLASQAFRYGVTRDPEALKIIRILMDGEVKRMRITGTPGLFTREYIPPGITGVSCPENIEAYVRSERKTDNKWVQIRDDGCLWYVDDKTMQWTASKTCGLKEFAGHCWVDNVSKDEYSGHMFALNAVVRLVDDPVVQAQAKDLLLKAGKHYVDNDLKVVDWDGRATQYGNLTPYSMNDYAGFNAALALSFMSVAARATNDPEITNFLDSCMLRKSSRKNCPGVFKNLLKHFGDFLHLPGLNLGKEGCTTNYDNVSMYMLGMFSLIWNEQDPKLREKYQHSFEVDVVRAPDNPRSVSKLNNPFYDIIWASQKRLGPGSDGPDYERIDNAIRMLRQFPERKHQKDVACTPELCTEYCISGLERPSTKHPRQVADLCMGTFVWWWDPYNTRTCKQNRSVVYLPSDYLLAYWMGRYFGFIKPDM